MKHVVALDVSMGKSTIVIYNANRQCQYEGELYHTRPALESLKERLYQLSALDGQAPEIVFEATGVYSALLERFFQTEGYVSTPR